MILFAALAFQSAGPTLPNGAFIHAPYLQIGNQTSVKDELTLVFRVPANDEAPYRVRYESTSGQEEVQVEARVLSNLNPPLREFTVDLSGLAPGRPFGYEVLQNGKSVFTSTGKAPLYAAKRWRMAAFGDCGFGSPQQAQVSFQVGKSNPDFILSTGDTVYQSSTAAEYETKFWSFYNGPANSPEKGAPLMRRIPWVAVPGNHDFYSKDLTKTPDGLAYFYYWKQPLNGPTTEGTNTPGATGKGLDAFLAAANGNYPRMANFSFDYGNAHFVVLDSNPNVDWADPKLREWLENDLKNARPDFWRIVSYHHPEFQSSKAHADNKWMRLLSDLFARNKVDLVLNGHVHNYQRTFPILESFKPLLRSSLYKNEWPIDTRFDGEHSHETDGVIRIVTGAGGAPLYNPEIETTKDKWLPFTHKYIVKHSFSLLDFNGDKLRFKQIGADGTLLDTFELKMKAKG